MWEWQLQENKDLECWEESDREWVRRWERGRRRESKIEGERKCDEERERHYETEREMVRESDYVMRKKDWKREGGRERVRERHYETEREGVRERERVIIRWERRTERESDYERVRMKARERELGRMREIEKRWEVISIEWDVGMEKIYELQSCSPCYTYLSAKHIWQNHLLAPLQIGIQHMQYFRAFKGLGSINSTF